MKIKTLKLQKGLSLLELMISLAIGIILLLALASLMVTASRSAAQRTTSEILDEEARQVFSRFEKDLYHAGYVDAYYDSVSLTDVFNISDPNVLARYARQQARLPNIEQVTLLGRSTNGRMQPLRGCNINFEGDPGDENTICNDNAAPVNDGNTPPRQSLQIAYQAVRNEVVSPIASAEHPTNQFSSLPRASMDVNDPGNRAARTCTTLAASGGNPIIINRYFLRAANRETFLSLSCDSAVKSFANMNRNADLQPLVLGVEQMAFRYMVTPSNDTAMDRKPELGNSQSGRTVSSYLHANQIDTGHADAPLGWGSVVGVEVCIVVAAEPLDGAREGDIPTIQPTIPNCLRAGNGNVGNTAFAGNLPRPNNDTRLYRRYTRTFSIPNSLYLRQ